MEEQAVDQARAPELCHPCGESGPKIQATHFVISNGLRKLLCERHCMPYVEQGLASFLFKLPAREFQGEVRKQEEANMPRRIEIDIEKLKELHSQGLSDVAIAAKLGCSGVTIGKYRRELGLTPGAKSGPHSGNGSSPRPKVKRKAASEENTPPSNLVTISVTEERLDRWWAALDLNEKGKVFGRAE
jgi:hypothetical protein